MKTRDRELLFILNAENGIRRWPLHQFELHVKVVNLPDSYPGGTPFDYWSGCLFFFATPRALRQVLHQLLLLLSNTPRLRRSVGVINQFETRIQINQTLLREVYIPLFYHVVFLVKQGRFCKHSCQHFLLFYGSTARRLTSLIPCA